jgi:hypothetical protein
MVKLAIIFNEHKLSGKLTKFWTGCYAYHCVWVDEKYRQMYDMHWIRRRRSWPHYPEYVLFDAPGNVTREYLEGMLDSDESWYGVRDYVLFLFRPVFHLFGKSTPNAKGVICSEMLNNDIWACGGQTPWEPDDAPPSPCDLYRFLS